MKITLEGFRFIKFHLIESTKEQNSLLFRDCVRQVYENYKRFGIPRFRIQADDSIYDESICFALLNNEHQTFYIE